MKEFFARLNPTERRFVVGVAVVFFLVINIVWVWPHFGDWGVTRDAMDDASKKLILFESGTNLIPSLQKEIEKYQNQGQLVPSGDQAVNFVRQIQNQAAMSGVIPESMYAQRQANDTNNPFFENQVENLTLQSGEKQLVDFLYNLGAGSNSLIRVKVLSLAPDPSHQRLTTRLTLMASYQKKSVGSAAAASGRTRRPAPENKPNKPAAAPTPAPAAARKPGPTNAAPSTVPRPFGATNHPLPRPSGAVKPLPPTKK
jgi:hypothetical protein